MAISVDLDRVADLAREVAARVHVPLFRSGVQREEKSPGELVSRVDREAEGLLLEGLRDLTPGIPVVGEEGASADGSIMCALQGDQPVWLVDPLDGTTQFLDGSPDHAIMLALVHAGRALGAVVHQPQHQRTYTAELGRAPGATGHACSAPQPQQTTSLACEAAFCGASSTTRRARTWTRTPSGSTT